jgi:hypothetical protein
VSVSASATLPATSADIPALSGTLAAAFFDDPVFSYCYPDVAQRQEILPRWFEIVTEANLPHGGIYTTDDGVAGAVCVPPDAEDDEQTGAALAEISGTYAQTLSLLERFDRDAMPAYLEATSEANKRLYLRHGFEETGEIKLPNGPSMWPMWRTPK